MRKIPQKRSREDERSRVIPGVQGYNKKHAPESEAHPSLPISCPVWDVIIESSMRAYMIQMSVTCYLGDIQDGVPSVRIPVSDRADYLVRWGNDANYNWECIRRVYVADGEITRPYPGGDTTPKVISIIPVNITDGFTPVGFAPQARGLKPRLRIMSGTNGFDAVRDCYISHDTYIGMSDYYKKIYTRCGYCTYYLPTSHVEYHTHNNGDFCGSADVGVSVRTLVFDKNNTMCNTEYKAGVHTAGLQFRQSEDSVVYDSLSLAKRNMLALNDGKPVCITGYNNQITLVANTASFSRSKGSGWPERIGDQVQFRHIQAVDDKSARKVNVITLNPDDSDNKSRTVTDVLAAIWSGVSSALATNGADRQQDVDRYANFAKIAELRGIRPDTP